MGTDQTTSEETYRIIGTYRSGERFTFLRGLDRLRAEYFLECLDGFPGVLVERESDVAVSPE